MDNLMLKVDIATNDLSLKSYSDKLYADGVRVVAKNFSDRQHFYQQIISCVQYL